MKRPVDDIRQYCQFAKRQETISHERARSMERLLSISQIFQDVIIPTTGMEVTTSLAEALFPLRPGLPDTELDIYNLIASGCLRTLQWVINKHPSLFNKHYIREGAMHVCCKYNQLDIMQWLYTTYRDIIHEPRLYLYFACTNGHLNVAKWIIRTFALIPSHPDKLFAQTCKHGHLAVAKWILDTINPSKESILNHVKLLSSVCYRGHMVVARWLFETFPDTLNECGMHRLSCAFIEMAKKNDMHTMKFIQSLPGAPRWEAGALSFARRHRNTEMIVWLLSLPGCPIEVYNTFADIVISTIQDEDLEMLQCLTSNFTMNHWMHLRHSKRQIIAELFLHSKDDTRLVECFFNYYPIDQLSCMVHIEYTLQHGMTHITDYLVKHFNITPQYFMTNVHILEIIGGACVNSNMASLMWLDNFLGVIDNSFYKIETVRNEYPGQWTPNIMEWLLKHAC